MISIHPGFLIFMLLLGLTLMVTVLYIDYANTSSECRDPTILSASRTVLILGTLLFASTATLLYTILISKCGYTEGEWSLVYTIFVTIIGTMLIVAGSIISIKGKQVNCPEAVAWSPVIWGIGTLMVIFTTTTIIWGLIRKPEEEDIESLKRSVEAEKSAADSAKSKADVEEQRSRLKDQRDQARREKEVSERRSVSARSRSPSRSTTTGAPTPFLNPVFRTSLGSRSPSPTPTPEARQREIEQNRRRIERERS